MIAQRTDLWRLHDIVIARAEPNVIPETTPCLYMSTLPPLDARSSYLDHLEKPPSYELFPGVKLQSLS